MARVSQFFEVINKMTIDGIISPKQIGESKLAAEYLLNIIPGDLILLDRRYPD